MALFSFALESLGMAPDPALLSRSGIAPLPGWVVLATWVLEAIGLAALFLLIQGRGGRLLAGLLTAFIRSDASLLGGFQAAGTGAIYGLFVGWIVGVATLGHRRGAVAP